MDINNNCSIPSSNSSGCSMTTSPTTSYLMKKLHSIDDVFAHQQQQQQHSMQQQFNPFCSHTNKKDLDYPPFSRLFVLYPKMASECELKMLFEKYGPIEDIWIVREKDTGLSKGIAYIKYSKASHAAKAIEELNGTLLNNHSKPLKVIISNSKNEKLNTPPTVSIPIMTKPQQISLSAQQLLQQQQQQPMAQSPPQSNAFNNDLQDSDRMHRLFVVIPKDYRKKDLRDAFKKFGEIENVQIIFNKSTNENKGFGYVRFYKASDAAKALEECHPSFKPKFAEPYSVKLARERDTTKQIISNTTSMNDFKCEQNIDLQEVAKEQQQQQQQQQQQINPIELLKRCLPNDCRVIVKCPIQLTLTDVYRLFSLVPGLIDLKCLNTLDTTGCSNEIIYVVTYETNTLASYAVKKVNGFKYPSGEIIYVAHYESFLNYIISTQSSNTVTSNKTLLDNTSNSNMNITGGVGHNYFDNLMSNQTNDFNTAPSVDTSLYDLNTYFSRTQLIA